MIGQCPNTVYVCVYKFSYTIAQPPVLVEYSLKYASVVSPAGG